MKTLLLLLALLLPATAVAEELKVAVLYFNNEGNDELSMLRYGLAEMLINDLAATDGLAVVERLRINEVLAELELQKTSAIDQSTAVELGKLLAVDRVVFGGYFEVMGQFILTARIVDISRGTTWPGTNLKGTVADFTTMLDDLGDALRTELVGSTDAITRGGTAPAATPKATPTPAPKATPAPEATPAAKPTPSEAAKPKDPMGAALAFSEGLDYLDRKDLKRAREALRRAVELDPTLDPARAALAEVDL